MPKALKIIGHVVLNLTLAAVTLGAGNIILEGFEAALAIGSITAITVRNQLRKSKKLDLSSQTGVKEEIRSSVAPRQILYGQTVSAGVLIYAQRTGSGTKADPYAVHMVYVIAGHAVTSFDTFYLNGEAVTLDGSGNVTSGDFAGNVRILTRDGAHTAALSQLVGETDFTTNHKGLGLAYYYVKFTDNLGSKGETAFPNGRPRVTVKTKGAKLYDPRLDSTAGGSGTHRVNDESTWAYSNNAALVAYDYMRRDPLGGRVANNWINVASVQAAANICDESVALDSGGTQNRYEADGVVFVNRRREDVLTDMLSAMAGEVIFQSGQFHIHAGADTAATVTFDETDLRGPMQVATKNPRRESFTRATGQFIDKQNDLYEATNYPPIIDSTAETAEGEVLELNIDFPFTTDGARAQRLAKIALKAAQESVSVSMPVKLKGLQVQAWSVVQVTNARFAWTNKKFRVLGWSLSPDGGVNLELVSYDPSIYAWNEVTEEQAVKTPIQPALGEDSSTGNKLAGVEDGADVTQKRIRNELLNGDFELGTKEGWTYSFGGASSDGTLKSIGGAAYNGSWVMEVPCGTGGPNQFSTERPITPGERVLMSCVARAVNGPTQNGFLRHRFIDRSGNLLSSGALDTVLTTDTAWIALRGKTPIAPANAAFYVVDLGDAGGTTGAYQFDAVRAGVIPADADIDALNTTNAPAEAGADVTGNNTANDTSNVSGKPASDVQRQTDDYLAARQRSSFSLVDADDNIWVRVYQKTGQGGRDAFDLDIGATGGSVTPGVVRMSVSFDWGTQAKIVISNRSGSNLVQSVRVYRDAGNSLKYMDIQVGTVGSTGTNCRIEYTPRTNTFDPSTVTLPATKNPTVGGTDEELLTGTGLSGVTFAILTDNGITHIRHEGAIDLNGLSALDTTGASRNIQAMATLPGSTMLNQPDGQQARILQRGPLYANGFDGDVFSFSPAFDSPPQFELLSPGGTEEDSGALTGRISRDTYMDGLTGSGGTLRSRLKELIGTPTVVQERTNFGGGHSNPEFRGDKTDAAQAADNIYTYILTPSAGPGPDNDMDGFPDYFSSVNVDFEMFIGGAWVQKDNVGYGGSSQVTRDISETSLGVTGTVFGLDVASSTNGGDISSFDGVDFNKAGAPGEETATPSGTAPVRFKVILGSEGGIS